MTRDTRIALFLMGELVAALRANDPDLFKRWLYGGIEDLGVPAVTELLLDSLDPFLTVEIPQLTQHNNKALAAAVHAGNSGQPLQQWF